MRLLYVLLLIMLLLLSWVRVKNLQVVILPSEYLRLILLLIQFINVLLVLQLSLHLMLILTRRVVCLLKFTSCKNPASLHRRHKEGVRRAASLRRENMIWVGATSTRINRCILLQLLLWLSTILILQSRIIRKRLLKLMLKVLLLRLLPELWLGLRLRWLIR